MAATRTWVIRSAGVKALVLTLTLAGCHSVPPADQSQAADPPADAAAPATVAPAITAQAAATDPGEVVPTDPAQASVAGEMALQAGDCRTASDDFAVAAVGATPQMASHATEVTLDCENIPAAWTAAQSWLKAAPHDPQAALVYATIALKLYHVPEARAAITTALAADAHATDAALTGAMQVLADQSDAATAFAALNPVVDTPQRSAAVLTALGELAVEAYDFTRAQHLVDEALQRDPKSTEAMRLAARIAVLRGDATVALTMAREVTKLDVTDGTFEMAEVLQDLGRTDEARKELERLRAGGDINTDEIDRRLALLALDSGDLQQAQKRFTDLMRGGEAGDGAMFYLAQIAEAQGDKTAALAIYRRLLDSSMAAQARVAAAGLLLDAGQRADAFAMIDGLGSHDARTTLDLVVQKAHLLADHADADGALALLVAALASYPHHPTLEYEYATMLERAGQTGDSVQAFEALLAERPEDPTVLNALGYTLADHRQQLPRAEKLIRQALLGIPDSPAALDSLGWVRLRRGSSREAAGILEHAYTVGQDPDIAAHWVEALWLSGSQTRARKVLDDALARHPESAALEATRHRLVSGSGHP
jgi:tetratricopeptide (TPR) repeat protein